MIGAMVLTCCGLSLAAASGYAGFDVVRSDPVHRPLRPGLLTAFSMAGMVIGFLGQIAGFWLFGAWWAAAVAAWFVIGFPISVEFLKGRRPEARLGMVWVFGLAGLAMAAGGAIMAVW